MKYNLWNNTNQLERIHYRFVPYSIITWKAFLKGVSVSRVIKSRFPFYFFEPRKPTSLSIELTDACDLKCLYCNNPLFSNPRIFMNETTFESIIKSVQDFPIDRIRVGGGEPTLHPKFSIFSQQLSNKTKYLSIVTNGQWKKKGIAEALISNYDLIEVSVDAGGAEFYEKSREGSSYDLLVENMMKLNTLKIKMNSKVHINIRFMVRPSNDKTKNEEYTFWKKYSNSIMPQYIVQHSESDYDEDIYKSVHIEKEAYPKCTLPFKDIQIRANGNIPLCQVTGSSTVAEKRKIIGNVKINSIQDMWTGSELTSIRKAHKERNLQKMEICKGCRGC